MHVWANGRMLGEDAATAVSVLDHGITVGDGVFETLKIEDSEPFALTRHLRRLARSAQGLGLAAPDEDAVRNGVTAVLAEEPIGFGRLRITYTAGPGPLGSARAADARPTLVVVADPMDKVRDPAHVVTVPWTRNERSAVAGLKTTSYAENVVALAYARERGAGEALFANTSGQLCEGTGSNVFYVVEDELRTPTLASGCLAGITRELVLEWYGGREVDAPLDVLRTADEVFLTSSTRDVQPVRRCDGREHPAPGPVTRRVMQRWTERAAESLDA